MSEIFLGQTSDFSEGDYRIFAVDGVEVGVFRVDGDLFAWRNHCPHFGGPVCQGRVFNRVSETVTAERTTDGLCFAGERHVICPWHGFEFDLRTGRHPGDPRYRLQKIELSVHDDQVFVRLP